MAHPISPPNSVVMLENAPEQYADILTPQALAFVAKLARKFEGRRRELMAARTRRQAEFDAGKLPDFLPETRRVREGDWHIGAVPRDLQPGDKVTLHYVMGMVTQITK